MEEDSLVINARETEITSLAVETSIAFVDANHRQGSVALRTSVTSLGLLFEGDLVAVAQFCYPRTAATRKKYTTELLRLAFKKSVRIRGGASKLIKNYIRLYRPSDLFTYQDTTGTVSSVYEQSGMTLVSSAKTKQYFVAPGKTRASAGKRESYSMASVVMRGPDALLGTTLGEVFNEDGTRKTNPELFLEDLGWHIEETSGDRVYEWFNPDVTFYTYKITALDSEKYYYGVSHVKKANATKDDCLRDGYYGSGGKHKGNKFSNWKLKHSAYLKKEVIETFGSKARALVSEASLIGDSWKNDPLCLNSVPGGLGAASNGSYGGISLKLCSTHGYVKHRGDRCMTCENNLLFSTLECSIHGETIHQGGSCVACSRATQFTAKKCSTHGVTSHNGGSCVKCYNSTVFKLHCPLHGETNHRGSTCSKCAMAGVFERKICSIHGETSHVRDSCVSCSRAASYLLKECAIHGEQKFRGDVCQLCFSEARRAVEFCPEHGETKHFSGVCQRCSSASTFTMRLCSIHGETLFRGKKCGKCFANRGERKSCEIHGNAIHYGNRCSKCMNEAQFEISSCEVHGESKHRAGKCIRCLRTANTSLRICQLHGESKHQGENCVKCLRQRAAHKKHESKKNGCVFCAEI